VWWTRAAFGQPVNPHLFRDVAATTVSLEDPAHVRMAAQLLGHATFATTERYYRMSRSVEAARAYHCVLAKRRREGGE
jgi:integrase/recombinase XerD